MLHCELEGTGYETLEKLFGEPRNSTNSTVPVHSMDKPKRFDNSIHCLNWIDQILSGAPVILSPY